MTTRFSFLPRFVLAVEWKERQLLPWPSYSGGFLSNWVTWMTNFAERNVIVCYLVWRGIFRFFSWPTSTSSFVFTRSTHFVSCKQLLLAGFLSVYSALIKEKKKEKFKCRPDDREFRFNKSKDCHHSTMKETNRCWQIFIRKSPSWTDRQIS